MPTLSNYNGLVETTAAQLRNYSGLAGVRVEEEQDPVLGLPDDGGRALVVEAMRRRPSPGQPSGAGKRLRNRFQIVITAVGFDMTSFKEAAKKRDDLIDQVEMAIMNDRSLGGSVVNLEIMGGEFYRASAPGNAAPFAAMGETILEMDVSAIS